MNAPSWRSAVLVVAAFVLAAVGLAMPSGSARAADCPPLPVDLKTLIAIDQNGPHPMSDQYPRAVWRYTEPPAACYGDATIRFTAFVGAPEGIGGTSAFRIEPTWIMAEAFVSVDATTTDPSEATHFFAVAVPPALAARFAALDGARVRIVGHFQDAAADGCVVTSGAPPDAPPPDVAIDICRTAFVLTSIRPLTVAPGTDTDAVTKAPGSPAPESPPWLLVVGLVALVAAYRNLGRLTR